MISCVFEDDEVIHSSCWSNGYGLYRIHFYRRLGCSELIHFGTTTESIINGVNYEPSLLIDKEYLWAKLY